MSECARARASLPGLPIGDTPFEIGPGDRLLLLSDGVTEAQGETGEAIDGFTGDAPQHDDITLLMLERR